MIEGAEFGESIAYVSLLTCMFKLNTLLKNIADFKPLHLH